MSLQPVPAARDATRRRRRLAIFGVLAAAHFVLIVAVLRQNGGTPRVADSSIQMIAVASPQLAVPVAPPQPTEAAITSDVPVPDFAVEASVGGGCALTADIANAVTADAAAVRELIAMPVAVRSVANAAMVWDGRWADAESAPVALRARIVATIRDASAECRDATVVGPRLVIVASAGGIALAFGSGRWKWSKLLIDVKDSVTVPE